MKRKYLSLPYVGIMILFTVIPIFLILYFSLTTTVDGETVFSTANYKRAFEPIYFSVLLKSVELAAKSTFICFLIGYPIAYILSLPQYRDKRFLLFLFVIPMWLNFLLRTYAWLTILETNGVINNILNYLGFPRQKLLYTDSAVMLGMVYNFLPFMILPIHTVLSKIDKSLLDASSDLGATPTQTFRRVVFPLSMPGVKSGITMVFMPALTTFIISDLLGGGQYILIGNLIEQQFLRIGDWNFGSALSIILMMFIVIFMIISPTDVENENGGIL